MKRLPIGIKYKVIYLHAACRESTLIQFPAADRRIRRHHRAGGEPAIVIGFRQTVFLLSIEYPAKHRRPLLYGNRLVRCVSLLTHSIYDPLLLQIRHTFIPGRIRCYIGKPGCCTSRNHTYRQGCKYQQHGKHFLAVFTHILSFLMCKAKSALNGRFCYFVKYSGLPIEVNPSRPVMTTLL